MCQKYFYMFYSFRNDGKQFGEKLRAVASELMFYADIMQGNRSDKFLVLDEYAGKLTEEFNKLSGTDDTGDSKGYGHEH